MLTEYLVGFWSLSNAVRSSIVWVSGIPWSCTIWSTSRWTKSLSSGCYGLSSSTQPYLSFWRFSVTNRCLIGSTSEEAFQWHWTSWHLGIRINKSRYLFNYLLEVLILMCIPNYWCMSYMVEFYNEWCAGVAYYYLNEILCLIMVCRIVLVMRCLLVQTRWFNNRA